ncbi:hypothetical protein B7486_66100 [cyanobacterium TDX16]|nr:hypothetical protein B7486_66100 [cyanobacterium TDX16]
MLAFRSEHLRSMRRAVFPVLQSSPNQGALIAKAACLSLWSRQALRSFAADLRANAQTLSTALEPTFGTPVYGLTETHLVLVDVRGIAPTGKQAEDRLEAACVLANRNQVPNDPLPPWEGSGLRFGSTVATILNYSTSDLLRLGRAIGDLVRGSEPEPGLIDELLDRYHRTVVNTASGPRGAATS